MKNFCVIDIGTNAVKVKIFANGEYIKNIPNRFISQVDNHVSKEDILKHVQSFIQEAHKHDVKLENIYIMATEGIRSAPNGKEIQEELEKNTHRKVHVLDPKREARLSILGGLSSIRVKNNPKQILFIESGGGSTEISLLNMEQKPFGIISSVSLPIGSRNGKEKLNQTEAINRFCQDIKKKGIKLDPSLQVIVNSVSAVKILAKQMQAEVFRPDLITRNQNSIKIEAFNHICEQILSQKDFDEDFKKAYFLKDETLDGFIGHVNVLHHIFQELQKHQELNLDTNCAISTTLGGLKEGAAKEIEKKYKREEQEENLKVTEGESTQVPSLSASSDKKYAEPLREFYKKVAQKEVSQYEEDIKAPYYKATIHRANGEKLHISATNANNIGIEAQDRQGEKKIPSYADFKNLVLYAKQQGQIISFGNIKSEEFRARLLLACIENDVKIQNQPMINPERIDSETRIRLQKEKVKKGIKEELFSKDKPQTNATSYAPSRMAAMNDGR